MPFRYLVSLEVVPVGREVAEVEGELLPAAVRVQGGAVHLVVGSLLHVFGTWFLGSPRNTSDVLFLVSYFFVVGLVWFVFVCMFFFLLFFSPPVSLRRLPLNNKP